MEFSIEKYISQFVESQFPDFYKEQGPTFIAFVKAYYEWMESNSSLVNSSNTVITNDLNVALKPPIHQSRNLLEYRDIDTTLTEFLEFIQIIEGVDQVNNFRFGVEDIVRNKFLIEIVNKYEKWKYENE